ncbi:MAG: response regulator [Chthoniobacteraceae bacterium]
MSIKVLIVDDEPNVRLMYRSSLESEGYELYEADSGAKALDQCADRQFDVAILDLNMPVMDGLELLASMRAQNMNVPVVIITAFASVPNAVSAMKLGAIDFLQKPILPDQLRSIIKDILVRHEPEKSTGQLHDFDYYLRCAKRAINLRDFAAAKSSLVKALELDSNSPQAFNLVGVMLEMREDYEQAKRYYGQSIKLDKHFEPAQQNMRRMFELFHFGSSNEPVNLDNK